MKTVFLFPGYGSQFVGMGKELYDAHRLVQEYFEQASHCLDINFIKLCFASSDIELGKMEHAYPSIFLTSCALFALVKERGIVPDAVAGFNQGEYAALFAAGGISFPDGLYLLAKYASFYENMLQEIDVEALRIRGVESKQLEKLCKQASDKAQQVFIAIYQKSQEHIVAGHQEAVERLRKLVIDLDDTTIDDVGIEVGLHSPIVADVGTQFKMYLEKVDFKDVAIPLIVDDHLKGIQDGAVIKQHIATHWQEPVKWPHVVDSFASYDLIVEIGPGTVLSGWAHERYPEKKIMSINKQEDIDDLQRLLEK